MKARNLILIAFMVSGMTALIYEVTWTRSLQLVFGSTIYAASTMLTAFFGGFALGSYLLRNAADNSKSPTKLFALLQFSIGIYGLFLVYIFKILTGIYQILPDSAIVKFSIAFFILVIPTSLFGGIWPVVYKTYLKTERFGKDAGTLYSVNSVGAFVGSIGAGFLIIPLLGITKTIVLASALNIIFAILVYLGGKNEN